MALPRRRTDRRTGSLAAAGEVVRDRRLQLGLTQSDVADLSGVGLSSVRALEAGKESVGLSIALDVLAALGLGLGVGPRPALLRAPDVLLLDRARDPR
ncbi:helix-turn-helix domain-containing protein [Klenkia sp. PcliD-1-E]|uniref:helix-turn-helix domain-containing protein n=1 Tax=Klenkia sp. PcliD-1-E TaxID=2954492 RepID=UPI00209732DB|nr:helix-turn-helix domain-containing protein [Klenkia sp. PcliD-1-E]MCO7218505.1 helix-turn-helix domain-containing protein [Klenkia sp. PcliD-1-E]